jgi:RHS repeat-associated protein
MPAENTSPIALPSGGGAIAGVGETFRPDLHTGTGNFSVPILVPPGRNSMQPALQLLYSTGQGNGPFGLGWALSLAGVRRKTSHGIPRYDDKRDVFVLSGAEDLVAVESTASTTRYRPRTEGLFARIERHRDSVNDYWQVTGTDGVVSFYGTKTARANDRAAVADPDDRTRVFAWHLTATEDPCGNRIEYEYERDTGFDGPRHFDQLYLSRIRYVNHGADNTRFLVSVELVYAERPDPFSDHRAGFEIRTRRRCTRIAVTTHADVDRVARSYDFTYADARADRPDGRPLNGVSLLALVTVTGHDGGRAERMPPLEFSYTRFAPDRRDFFAVGGADAPATSLADADLSFVDLFGVGLPDLLQMNGGGTVRYWRNLGGGQFDSPRPMATAPGGVSLVDPGVQLLDADGDGRTDLVVTSGALSGFFPLADGRWDTRSFRRYTHAPSFSLADPEVRLVDLDGDGITDAVRSGARFECFFNDPDSGWGETRAIARQALTHFPNVSFADPRVRWADFSGDGLQDVALVTDGSVDYWPNRGYGQWGERVHMAHSPRLPFNHDPRRVLVGDVDGDGLADIVYVDDTKVTLWINQSGNGWSEPITISGTPPVSDIDGVRIVDLLGSGVAGVLWTRRADGVSPNRSFFLDFTGGAKPYLIAEMDNHIGAQTRVEYAPSTRYYLEDARLRGNRWKTTLPFPVQVVARVRVSDTFSKSSVTTEYRYHHGYWDGAEREFRGFGMVEQFDTEAFDAAGGERHFYSSPTMMRTWFHQGPVGEEYGDWSELDWSDQYWTDDPPMLGHTERVNAFLRSIPTSPDSRRIKRDALRALRGSVLRTELYALDGSPREHRPYTVSESSYNVAEIEPPSDADDRRRRIFFPHLVAMRSTQWERGTDPQTTFTLTRYRRRDSDPIDPFGRPIAQTSVACPRGWKSMDDRPASPYLATYGVTTYAAPATPSSYLHTRQASVTTFEVTGSTGKTVAELQAMDDGSPGLEVIGHARHYYDGPAFLGLPLGQVATRGLLTRSETLALTDDVLQDGYGAARPPYVITGTTPAWPVEYPAEFRTLLAARAGYRFSAGSASPLDPGGYFIETERRAYDVHTDPNGRGLVVETRDPLHDPADPAGHRVLIDYDGFAYLPERVTDAAGLTVTAEYDYRVMRPSKVIDANGNQTRFAYSPTGMLEASWVAGRSAAEGDSTRASVRFEYGLRTFDESPADRRAPIFVRTIRHVHHDTASVPAAERNRTITTIEYSDGFGRVLQARRQDDDVRFGDEAFGGGSTLLSLLQSDASTGDVVGRLNTDASRVNVVVNGWRVYDNKGQIVEQYEPFFSEGWEYGPPEDAQRGRRLTTFYDPRGHAIRTLGPDGSEQVMVHGVPGRIAAPDLARPDAFEPTPWETYTYDANDNAGRTHPTPSVAYRHHWDTPSSVLVDALGRTIESVDRNRGPVATPTSPLGPTTEVRTRTAYDIRGNVTAVTDAMGRTAIRNVFDLANRALRTTSIDAGERRVVFDAGNNAVETRSGTGVLTLCAFDRLNRSSRVWARDRDGEAVTLRERYEYGDGGIATQPAAERAAARTANRLGRLARVFDGAGELTFAVYDFKGNLAEKKRRTIADAAVLAVFAGPPAGWTVPAHRVDWTTPAAVQLETTAYTSSLVYDALNRATRVTLPDDVEDARRVTVPEYAPSGALRTVRLDSNRFVERIAYNAAGMRVLIVYSNGVMTRYAHDPQTFRLVRLRSERVTTVGDRTYRPSGEVLQDIAYEYDLAGNVVAMHDRTPKSGIPGSSAGVDALDRAFVYDALYRLRSATGRECDAPPSLPWDSTPRCTDLTKVRPWTERYAFDALGGLTELHHQSGASAFVSAIAPTTASNRVATLTQGSHIFAYAYDDNGNLIRETTSRHLEWDHRDRLRAYRTQTTGSEPTIHAHYLYDWNGQRVKKVVRKPGGRIEVAVSIDGVFEHERIVAAGGAVTENDSIHVMDDRRRIAIVRVGPPLEGDTTPAVTYRLADHLGSSAVVVAGDGSLVNREEYLPFGSTSFGSFARKRYRFGSHERDGESDLYYCGARYYLPWLGRWASCDPAGPVDGLNLYVYVRNNPCVLTDPRGREGENDYGGTSPDGGLPDPRTTSHERPADHEASTPKAEEPPPPPPPPPKAPTPEEVYAAQQKAAYERSKAERHSFGQVTKSLARAWMPATMTATSPAPRMAGVNPGMEALSDPGAQNDINTAGGEVAKKIAEHGGTAATLPGDVGLAGANVGIKTIGSIAAEEAPKAAPNLIARAAEIHLALAQHMSVWSAERTTVAVTRATIDGVTHTVVTVNNRKAHQLMQTGIVQIAEHEMLGQAPTRYQTWYRLIWRFTNAHAEDLGIRTLKRMGATGGETATAPWRGCFRCQMMIDRLNGVFENEWVHLNPDPDVVLRPFR